MPDTSVASNPAADDPEVVPSPTAPASLQTFLDNGLITDVLRPVKSGKEGTVYCCRAHPSTGADLLAAKVYRPRDHRGFRNDAIYQQGRVITDRRVERAVKGKTRFGREAQAALWLGHEFETLQALHGSGADVPRPIAQADEAILLEFVGDEGGPAPMLSQVRLTAQEARPLFAQVVRNVELWLSCNLIHADLSPFNILVWKGALTVIDFPQAVDPRFNPSAPLLLARDLEHVCDYFARYGIKTDPARMAHFLWERFLRAEL